MKTLILGASGFIGGHIAKAAVASGWQVRGLRRNPRNFGMLDESEIDWVQGDLDQPEDLEPIFQGVDVVFHAAGYYPSDSKDVPAQVAHSVQQTSSVIRLAEAGGVRRLIYISSFTTMVPPLVDLNRLVDETDWYQPGSYAASAYYECKLAVEKKLLVDNRNLEVLCLNPTMVLGPEGKFQGTGAIFLAVARGWGLVWLPAKVNVVDVRDVAQACLTAVDQGRSGERYLIGGHNTELRLLIEAISRLANVRRPWLKVPLSLVDALVWLEDHLPGVNVFSNHLRTIRIWPHCSIEKASRELAFHVRPLEETLAETLESYRQRGYL
jgi:nucleoside-diphosphate-sugar epimerase